jgi:multimeric flavodoxin WrbA
MKFVGILGSVREGGNTEVLLDAALEEAQKNGVIVDKVPLRDKSVAPCDGCGGCTKTGRCLIDDDAQEICQKMLASDGIIWATPVYFWSMTGQTKTLMDRTYALLFPKLQLTGKVDGLIVKIIDLPVKPCTGQAKRNRLTSREDKLVAYEYVSPLQHRQRLQLPVL